MWRCFKTQCVVHNLVPAVRVFALRTLGTLLLLRIAARKRHSVSARDTSSEFIASRLCTLCAASMAWRVKRVTCSIARRYMHMCMCMYM